MSVVVTTLQPSIRSTDDDEPMTIGNPASFSILYPIPLTISPSIIVRWRGRFRFPGKLVQQTDDEDNDSDTKFFGGAVMILNGKKTRREVSFR